jgi:hypothetical protein
MKLFVAGQRVELISCEGFPGTVIGFARGRVEVRFDDVQEAVKTFRMESLQLTKKDHDEKTAREDGGFGNTRTRGEPKWDGGG